MGGFRFTGSPAIAVAKAILLVLTFVKRPKIWIHIKMYCTIRIHTIGMRCMIYYTRCCSMNLTLQFSLFMLLALNTCWGWPPPTLLLALTCMAGGRFSNTLSLPCKTTNRKDPLELTHTSKELSAWTSSKMAGWLADWKCYIYIMMPKLIYFSQQKE